jgi:hypothetical protein
MLGALAPTVSHVLRASGANGLVEVCTAMGAKWVAAEQTAPGESAPATVHTLDDCPYCALQVHSPALPLALATGFVASVLQFSVPRLFLLAPSTPHAWLTAQPRAPPQLS